MQIVRTEQFKKDYDELRDSKLAALVYQRIIRAGCGNFGDHKSVGGGVSEMRIHYGAGWRMYYTIRGNKLIILLCGGDKKTQSRDIKRAQEIAQEV